mmetsp:Transcript_113822/g.361778  ORF Transcript_113822/g.361778 Transcript_113822/m.361778 type:complete len:89 (-) Transcript_113822:209-475(-)
MGHLSWYCIVVNNGCCGNVGYFIWALLYVLSCCSYFVGGLNIAKLIYLLLLIPSFYCGLSFWKLGAGTTAREIAGAVQGAAQGARNAH